jgi:hypothetical protein
MDGVDTLFVASVAVGSGDTLSRRTNQWEFNSPRGRRVIRAREENPTWVPPLWHFHRSGTMGDMPAQRAAIPPTCRSGVP